MSDEDRISLEVAVERGYQFAIVGWNHRANTPIICPIQMAAGFSYRNSFKPSDLERAHQYVFGDWDCGGAGDIPDEGKK